MRSETPKSVYERMKSWAEKNAKPMEAPRGALLESANLRLPTLPEGRIKDRRELARFMNGHGLKDANEKKIYARVFFSKLAKTLVRMIGIPHQDPAVRKQLLKLFTDIHKVWITREAEGTGFYSRPLTLENVRYCMSDRSVMEEFRRVFKNPDSYNALIRLRARVDQVWIECDQEMSKNPRLLFRLSHHTLVNAIEGYHSLLRNLPSALPKPSYE